MKLKIFYNKSISGNAAYYFDKAKKARKKQEGVLKTIDIMKKKLDKIKKKERKENKNEVSQGIIEHNAGNLLQENKKEGEENEELGGSLKVKKGWFTKFRWFFTSNNILAVGGRDAVTNEIIIKKHMEEKDLIFHTDAPGSPFFLLKLDKKYDLNDKNKLNLLHDDIEEVAQATACYSKAWSLGVGYTDAYYVQPTQVSKKAKSGEYLTKGSFMVYGKRNILRVKLEIGVSRIGGKLLIGPLSLIEKKAKKYVVLTPGSLKKSDAVKRILSILFGKETKKKIKPTLKKSGKYKKSTITKTTLKEVHDTLISQLPSGGFSIDKIF